MKGSERSRALDEALQQLGQVLENLQAGVLVNAEGLAIAAYPKTKQASATDPLRAAQVAAVTAALAGAAERSLERLDQGRMGRLLLESETGTLLNFPAGQAMLALLVAPEANLGQALFAAQKTAAEIAIILASD